MYMSLDDCTLVSPRNPLTRALDEALDLLEMVDERNAPELLCFETSVRPHTGLSIEDVD